MNSGTENIYWGALLVFAFFMHHCSYSPIFKKNLIKVLTKTPRILYNAIKDKKTSNFDNMGETCPDCRVIAFS